MPAAAIIPIASALIGAGMSYYQNSQNVKAQEKANQANLAWEAWKYDADRANALADWHRNNAYNSPQQVMQRFREAGLNPNLIYGNNPVTPQVRATSGGSAGQRPVMQDLSGISSSVSSLPDAINTVLSGRRIQAETDNLKKQSSLLEKEGLLKDASTAEIMQRTARSKFDLSQADRMKDDVYENQRLQNDALRASTDSTNVRTVIDIDRNTRERLRTSVDIQKTLQDILHEKLKMEKTTEERYHIQRMIRALDDAHDLNEYDKRLRQNGLDRGSPGWIKFMEAQLSKHPKRVPGPIKSSNPRLDKMDNNFADWIINSF